MTKFMVHFIQYKEIVFSITQLFLSTISLRWLVLIVIFKYKLKYYELKSNNFIYK